MNNMYWVVRDNQLHTKYGDVQASIKTNEHGNHEIWIDGVLLDTCIKEHGIMGAMRGAEGHLRMLEHVQIINEGTCDAGETSGFRWVLGSVKGVAIGVHRCTEATLTLREEGYVVSTLIPHEMDQHEDPIMMMAECDKLPQTNLSLWTDREIFKRSEHFWVPESLGEEAYYGINVGDYRIKLYGNGQVESSPEIPWAEESWGKIVSDWEGMENALNDFMFLFIKKEIRNEQ